MRSTLLKLLLLFETLDNDYLSKIKEVILCIDSKKLPEKRQSSEHDEYICRSASSL